MDSTVKYLLSLQAVRDRAEIVAHAAQAGKLNHFDFHQDRMADVADTVAAVIKVGPVHLPGFLHILTDCTFLFLARLWP